MNQPTVSVIIPVYNGGEYLEQCIISVLEQDLEDIEIICVDDGSDDNTVDIIKYFQKQHRNIVLLQQANQGAAIARNNALSVAKGKYVAFMDADDYYIDKTGLRLLYETCEDMGLAICGSGSFMVNDNNSDENPTKIYRSVFFDTNKIQRLKYIDYQYDYYYVCYLFRRNFLAEHNITFPNLRRYQDPPFLVQAMWYAAEFMVVPIDLYCVRRHPTAREFSFVQINDLLKGIIINLQFAKEHHLLILYNSCIDRLNNDYYRVLINTIICGNMSALKYLLDISEYIADPEVNKAGKKIDVLEKVKQILGKSQMGDFSQYRLPYESVHYGSKVAIYGAGHIGKTIADIINYSNYCNIVAWVDQQFEFYQGKGLSVEAPDYLQESDFDYILVAIENESVYKDIKEKLLNKGWNKGKPILRPIHL